MLYQKREDLIALKKTAGLTYRDFTVQLGVSPGTVGGKFTGFVVLTDAEEKIIRRVCLDCTKKQEEVAAA